MGQRRAGHPGRAPPHVRAAVQLSRGSPIIDSAEDAAWPIWGEDRRAGAPDAASLDSLPSEFPIFPLSRAVLLPRGRLPLNIFEPRYLNMIDEALAGGRMLGMIQPNRRGGSGEALERVGCLGRLASFGETDDGCYLVTLVGLARFTVAGTLPDRRGFRRVRASFEGYAADLLPPAPVLLDRDLLLGSLRRYFRVRELDANWDAIAQMPDDQLVTTLCMVCPFGEAEKQALLEAATDHDRAGDLLTLLEIGGHEREEGSGRAS